jgi:aspartokinase
MIFSRYTFNIIQQNKLKIHIRNLYDQRNDGTYITATTTAPYLLINEFSNLSMVNFDRLIKIPDLETIPYSLAANDHSSIIINGNLIDQINKIFNSISHHFVANIYTVFITSNCLSERVFNQLIKTLEEQKLSPLTYQLNTRKNLSVLVFDQSVNKQKAIEIIYHHLISIIQQ